MDLPESQEQFEQELMDNQAEEQSALTDIKDADASSDLQPAATSNEQIPTDMPHVEIIEDTQDLQEKLEREPSEAMEMKITDSSSTPKPATASKSQLPTDLPHVEVIVEGPAWYVIHCYSGYENKVRHNLEQRIETMGMKDRIFDVVIPTQEEVEVKDGKRRTVERHIFPGYVLVNLALSEESWYVVRNTPGVTGFVGMGNNPTPLRPEEVAQIVKRMEAEAPTVKVSFKVGERIRIVDGPFNDFRGTVAEIDMERTKVRVMVSFFGRETPVELDFLQVEKA